MLICYVFSKSVSLGLVSLLGQNVHIRVHEAVLGKSEKKAKRRQFPVLLTRVTSAFANGIISDFLTLSAQLWPRGGLQRDTLPQLPLSLSNFGFQLGKGGRASSCTAHPRSLIAGLFSLFSLSSVLESLTRISTRKG